MAQGLPFPGFKGCITVNLCGFLNLPDDLFFLFYYLPLPTYSYFIHITNDYNLIVYIQGHTKIAFTK